jgi:integrase
MQYDGRPTQIIEAHIATSRRLAPAIALVEGYASQARSERTRLAYSWQWRRFTRWCARHQLTCLPAASGTVAMYLSAGADGGLAVATLAQALAAIGEAHRLAGHESPRGAAVVRETWKGIRRAIGISQRRVAPLLVEDLRLLIAALPNTLIGKRDRAMMLVGFAGAFRRGELVGLTVADLFFADAGLIVRVRRSKTDQEGAGIMIGIPRGALEATCPVRALKAWLEAACVYDGSVFRAVDRHGKVRGGLQARDAARILKRRVSAAGLDASRYSGHSLRAGLATSSAKAGKSDRSIMRQGRWSSRAMVDRYVRDATLLGGENAAAGVGL